LSHFQRAAVLSFVAHFEALDRVSRALLRTMRVLAGLDSSREFLISTPARDELRPSRWDPGRFIRALYPPAVFIAAFLFWIVLNPPTGPKVPMFAGILSLVILRTPMNPLPLLAVFVLSICLAVAPVYWFVMPHLSTGFSLLSLIFVYSFFFGFLGGRSPALKSGPIIMFAVMTGISNQQSYSFQGPVDGALMVLLSGVIMTVVYVLISPMRPEQALLDSLRRFFRGCARVTGGIDPVGPANRLHGRRFRKRCYESMVLPAPGKIQAAQRHLDYKLYPDNPPEIVQRLLDSMQSIIHRLQSLEIAHDRIARHSSESPEAFVLAGRRALGTLQCVFESWTSVEPGNALEQQRESLQGLSREMQRQFDTLEIGRDQDRISDQMLADLYTMLGSIRGLIESMAKTQSVITQINWQQWATPRF
jgi:hypothetical protein